MNKFNKFEEIKESIYNGAISQAKKWTKNLSREQRYDLIMWLRRNEGDYYKSSDVVMCWCVKGEFK